MKPAVGTLLVWMLGCSGLTTSSAPAPASMEVSKMCLKDALVGITVPAELEWVGSFAKTRATEDHVYGYAIDLFRGHGPSAVRRRSAVVDRV